MTRALSIFLIAITLPQAAMAAHGGTTSLFPRGSSLGLVLQAHFAPAGTPVCHHHDTGEPFHCSCDGPFNLLCPDNMNLGKSDERPALPSNFIVPTPTFNIDQ